MADLLSLVDVEWLRFDLLGRLLLAAVLGGIIGLEREWSGKPAGFRTNLLICVGAALLTELSLAVAASADPWMTADPGRIAAQIVSGIGFLGAGTIIQSRGNVVGLTTAATLWVVAAIGMAVGTRAYMEAAGATVLVVVALLLLGKLEPVLGGLEEHVLQVTMDWDSDVRARVEETMGGPLRVDLLEIERQEARAQVTYRVEGRPSAMRGIVGLIADLDGVHRVVRS